MHHLPDNVVILLVDEALPGEHVPKSRHRPFHARAAGPFPWDHSIEPRRPGPAGPTGGPGDFAVRWSRPVQRTSPLMHRGRNAMSTAGASPEDRRIPSPGSRRKSVRIAKNARDRKATGHGLVMMRPRGCSDRWSCRAGLPRAHRFARHILGSAPCSPRRNLRPTGPEHRSVDGGQVSGTCFRCAGPTYPSTCS